MVKDSKDGKVVCKLMHGWLYGRLAKPFWARWPGVEKKSLKTPQTTDTSGFSWIEHLALVTAHT